MPERRIEQQQLLNLPAYTLRVSARAKRARIEVSPFGAVEVVVPKRFNPKRVPVFLTEHQDWLNQTLEHVEARRLENPVMYERRPSRIELPAIACQWSVKYTNRQRASIVEKPNLGAGRILSVRNEDDVHCRRHLQRWLHERAQRYLVPRVYTLSEELGFKINKVIVRGQKTRWGSCSSLRTISINRNLLFLPKYLAEYLFIHELCHTVHMNHSKRYWNVVAAYEPDYEARENELAQAYCRVPFWAYPE